MAEEGIRAIAAALPRLSTDPRDLDARGDALYGAWLCGTVLGAVAMGLHHKLCHTLGGSFNLPHAEVHTVDPAARAGLQRRCRAAGDGAHRARAGRERCAARACSNWRAHGAPTSLRAIGMPADGLDRAADLAVQHALPEPAAARTRGAARAAAARLRW